MLKAGGAGSIRAGSMADRARLAKAPQPEPPQKCPRLVGGIGLEEELLGMSLWVEDAEETRRRKAAAVPVAQNPQLFAESKVVQNSTHADIPSEITAHLPHQTPHLSFMASLQSFSQKIREPITSSRSSSQTNGLHPLQSEYMETSPSMVGESQLLRSTNSSSRVSQRAPVRMENSNQRLNLPRSLMGVLDQNNQYWGGGNGWTDLSGLKSSYMTYHPHFNRIIVKGEYARKHSSNTTEKKQQVKSFDDENVRKDNVWVENERLFGGDLWYDE
ncbi:hypothetical protein V6N12_041721 [Hibiscus sabdariffa]|uniref:Uncharacterized protein n=1 Tax=Hibiscus sabdariffa TaxID=183260 RepID=A0ABR2A1N7_9ROSI